MWAAVDTETGMVALEVEVLELETAVALLAAGIPVETRRAPFPHEIRAPINFTTIKDRLDQAGSDMHGELVRARHDLIALLAAYLLLGDPTPAQVVQKINNLVLASKLPNGVREVIERTRQRAVTVLQAVADGALVDTQLEADQSGMQTATPDRASIRQTVLAQAARMAVAPWLAAINAMRTAAQRDAGRPHMTAARLVQLLAEAAGAASLAGLMDDAKQATNVLQGTARTEGLRQWEPVAGQVVVAYASELLDDRTCLPCSDIDGTEYTSLIEAFNDYPAGQYGGCHGGPRCRGQLVVLVDDAARNAVGARQAIAASAVCR